MPIRLPNNDTVALNEVATITASQSPSALYRTDRFTTMNVTSDAEKGTDLEPIKSDLEAQLNELLSSYPNVSYELEGEAKEQRDSFSSLGIGMVVVLLVIYTKFIYHELYGHLGINWRSH